MANLEQLLTAQVNLLGELLAKATTAALQDHAINTHNWSSNIANQLTVVYKKGRLYEDHPAVYDQQIKALEYGTADIGLAPAIRTFAGDK